MKIKSLYLVVSLSFVLFTLDTNLLAQETISTAQQTEFATVSKRAAVKASKPKVFIAPTQDGFGNFISAAILENKVPVDITASEETADYIIVSSSAKGQNKWYDTMFGTERDRNQGSMKLIRISDKTVVWASASGDRSIWWGGLKNMGQAKVANRLARKMKDALPKIAQDAANQPPAPQDKKTLASEILQQETAGRNLNATSASGQQLNAEEHNQEGVRLFGLKVYPDAEKSFREAVKLEPYNAAYHFNLGTVLNAQNKFDDAEKEVELATRLAPNEQVYKKGLEVIRTNKNSRILVKTN